MPSVACIVEGQGDWISIPIVLRRIAEREGVFDLRIVGPFRVQRYAIVRPGELERAVERAARSVAGQGGILVVLDADDDLPCELGPSLASRAAAARGDVPTAVVIANREKEAWYVAAVAFVGNEAFRGMLRRHRMRRPFGGRKVGLHEPWAVPILR